MKDRVRPPSLNYLVTEYDIGVEMIAIPLGLAKLKNFFLKYSHTKYM